MSNIKYEEIVGFGDNLSEEASSNNDKKQKKTGGFQSMGLSFSVLKGITKKGYKVPTPIQRKVSFS